MYLTHFGLREPPFELTASPRFLYLTPQHREALANLQYGLSTAKAITLLIGEAGTGKTTMLKAALQSEPCRNVQAVHVCNPGLSRAEFIETLARGFRLSRAAHGSKAVLLAELEVLLREKRDAEFRTALIVDEAQRLSDDLLEEVRLLSNLETESEKLLPLVLAGQPELADRMNLNSMRQLKQRVALRCEIAPFTLTETAAYIASRIRMSGGDASRLFTREAVMLIHDYAKGVARTISVICDNALLNAFAAGRASVGSDVVRETVRDFDLSPAPVPQPVRTAGAPSPEIEPGHETPSPPHDRQRDPEPSSPFARPRRDDDVVGVSEFWKRRRSSIFGLS
jgi:general secretion pathway protein A